MDGRRVMWTGEGDEDGDGVMWTREGSIFIIKDTVQNKIRSHVLDRREGTV